MYIKKLLPLAVASFLWAYMVLPPIAFAASPFDRSHVVHWWDNRGPNLWNGSYPLTCDNCHIDNTVHHETPILFNDTKELGETTVCDGCHSKEGAFNGVAMAKANWDSGIYTGTNYENLQTGKEQWCISCHDSGSSEINSVSAPNVELYYISGHGKAGADVGCLVCHDATFTHIDGNSRTYSFKSTYYSPSQSGVAYASGYRLRYINGEVPLMIPANYSTTFSNNAQTMKNNAFRLCFSCHDVSKILDNTPGDGLDTNFKASQPNPPRNYSYAWGSGADTNEHVAHIMNYIGPFADSDWDTSTSGSGGGSNGRDTMTACSSCHNVHGAAGVYSTNEAMIRDGSLAGRTGYGFSYVIEDVASGGYPWVTSTGATQSTSVGAIFRNNTSNMCAGSMCHGNPTPPAASSYNASGSSWGTYLEYYRVPQTYLEFIAECPVDIQVIDPLGRIVDKFRSEIWGAKYIESDFNGDGSIDDKIIIPNPRVGNYTVLVIPEPGADPADTYTLKVINGEDPLIITQNAPIGDIDGEETFEVTFTSEGIKLAKLLSPKDHAILSEPVTFNWESIGYGGFKIQFSSDRNFSQRGLARMFGNRILTYPYSRGKWLSETSFTPTKKEWREIKRISRRNSAIYWRVIAADAEGNTGSSEIRSFSLSQSK
jgi:hypothetical protein